MGADLALITQQEQKYQKQTDELFENWTLVHKASALFDSYGCGYELRTYTKDGNEQDFYFRLGLGGTPYLAELDYSEKYAIRMFERLAGKPKGVYDIEGQRITFSGWPTWLGC